MMGGQVPEKSEPEPTKITEDKFVIELTAKNFSDGNLHFLLVQCN